MKRWDCCCLRKLTNGRGIAIMRSVNYNKGISGLIITGSSKTSATYDGKDHSAKAIFLPTTGYRIGQYAYPGNYAGSGCYWSGTLYTNAASAYYFNFDSNNITLYGYFRYHGLPVRPVTE